jgi:3-dehydro-L-gulonate 2-dehydrogenase
MLRVKYEEMLGQFKRVLLSRGLDEERAQLCATLFAQTSLDGVYTHGLNRFPKFIDAIDTGIVNVNGQAEAFERHGVLERWDGKCGIGNLNAHAAMARAIELAKEGAIGCVAMRNNNHWMRPGAYGLLAADSDCIGICWTNTLPNMPAWGGKDPKIGNNPMVISIPKKGGHVLLDIAMSLFSYGKMETSILQGKQLPYEGGFDEDGNLTKDPKAIMKSRQPLPIGYWKGSGLSIMLDLLAAALSGGNTTRDIGFLPHETACSQFFLAIDLSKFPDRDKIEESVQATAEDIASSIPLDPDSPARYPGAGVLRVREENTRLGIPVIESVWEKVLAL